MTDGRQERMRDALKIVAVALKRTGLPFALVGGYAVWARGGPEPDHDVDFLVAEEDAGTVAAKLADAGLQVEHPPEDWLFKVFVEDAMVDVIHRDAGRAATRTEVCDADDMEVLSVAMPVISGTKLLIQKLTSLNEHACDFGRLLPVARALREQVDWGRVREATADSPFAAAFLHLAEQLSVVPPPGDEVSSEALSLER